VSGRTITVTDDAYLRLLARKGRDESFSELIVRLIPQRPLASFSGTLSAEASDRLKNAVQRERRRRAQIGDAGVG
jgi:predicted CopG family antitoxin